MQLQIAVDEAKIVRLVWSSPNLLNLSLEMSSSYRLG